MGKAPGSHGFGRIRSTLLAQQPRQLVRLSSFQQLRSEGPRVAKQRNAVTLRPCRISAISKANHEKWESTELPGLFVAVATKLALVRTVVRRFQSSQLRPERYRNILIFIESPHKSPHTISARVRPIASIAAANVHRAVAWCSRNAAWRQGK
jgi:hypothetical protein